MMFRTSETPMIVAPCAEVWIETVEYFLSLW